MYGYATEIQLSEKIVMFISLFKVIDFGVYAFHFFELKKTKQIANELYLYNLHYIQGVLFVFFFISVNLYWSMI